MDGCCEFETRVEILNDSRHYSQYLYRLNSSQHNLSFVEKQPEIARRKSFLKESNEDSRRRTIEFAEVILFFKVPKLERGEFIFSPLDEAEPS